MSLLETTIAKAMKRSQKTGETLYVFATYYKVVMSFKKPPFGAAHWVVKGGEYTRVESTL
jgi:hypothetical protein